MTKSMWVAVVILFLLFTACGVFMVLLQKDEELKNVHAFLTRNGINTAVSYRGISLAVSDVAVLKGVSVRLNALPSLENDVKRFTVRDYRESGGVPSKIAFEAEKVSLRLTDVARLLKGDDESVINALASFNPVEDVLNRPLYALMLAGCDRISANVTGEYSYSPSNGNMRLKAGISDRCLGAWSVDVSLSGVSNAQQGQLVLAFKHFLRKGDPLKDVKNFLNGATVTAFSASYTESGLVRGYKRYIDTLYLRRGDAADVENGAVVPAITGYLSMANAHRQRNAEIAKTLAAFLNAPDRITFQSKAGKKVPLRVLSGTFLRRMTDLLLRLDASVVLEKSTF